jgi:PKD repeat protein
VVVNLTANDTNTSVQAISLRVISQPGKGMVGLTNKVATYYPPAGFVGTETFTFAAWNGASDSNLGTGTVSVAQGPFAITSQAQVPPSYPAGWAAPFGVTATLSNINAAIVYDWDFGDGSAHSTNQYAAHTYTLPGSYNWKISSTVTSGSSKSATSSGTIVIGNPVLLSAAATGTQVILSWPKTTADAVLEGSLQIGAGAAWTVVTNAVTVGANSLSVTVPNANTTQFFRLRKI